MTKTHTRTHLSIHWQSMGRKKGFHTSARPALRSQTSWFEFAKQNTLIWPLSVEKNVEFPEISVL